MNPQIEFLNRRIVSSLALDQLIREDVFQWANEIINSPNHESVGINIIAGLNSDENSLIIKDYVKQAIMELSLFIPNPKEAPIVYIESIILELETLQNIDKIMNRLHNHHLNRDDLPLLHEFDKLYWARESWKNNDENKRCYIKDYEPSKEEAIILRVCKKMKKQLSKN